MPFTYSQLVDRVVARSKRPDRQLDIEDFVNQSVREVHSNQEGMPVFFAKNLIEDTITTTAETGFLWTPPTNLQRVLAFRYSNVTNPQWPDGVYPVNQRPGRGQNCEKYFYYRSGRQFAFKGYGGLNVSIDTAYYILPPRLKYFLAADRPASYDIEAGWSYHDDYDDTAALMATAETLVSNWIIFDWYDLVFEGTMAKIWKLQDDEKRSATHFSAFQRERRQLMATEKFESLE